MPLSLILGNQNAPGPVEKAPANGGTGIMEKKETSRKAKNVDREDKPGIIVAGPEAHARERGGKMPVGRSARQKDDPAKKPTPRP